MIVNDVGQALVAALNEGLLALGGFIPKFVAGLIVLLVGLIVASVLRQVVIEVLKALKVEQLLHRYGVPEAKAELSWSNILAEIVRWFVIVLFILPTADIWGLTQVTAVLNQVLLYIPKVLVATIIALVGLAFAKLSHDAILASVHGISRDSAKTVATVTRWAIVGFVVLAVLDQLGVAPELIRILVTGFVAMLAIAGGIAFGLGGQGAAKDVVDELRKKLD
ncbi:hypothetical protein HYS29_01980 [Candidatus Microgenomates bacterium]|nr:hypothetical protein [Candidatus Microgenomates bacterium]MBI2622388.1 hypothetical protein [Candidatus Microgenomates bacterium]